MRIIYRTSEDSKLEIDNPILQKCKKKKRHQSTHKTRTLIMKYSVKERQLTHVII